MRYELSIPARINLLGNPSDGNEGDFATISAAVDLRARAIIEPTGNLVFEDKEGMESQPGRDSDIRPRQRLEFNRLDLPLPINGEMDLLKGAVNRLHGFSQEFRTKIRRHGFYITAWSDVPRQSGLGGSSLFVLLTLAGLRELYQLDPWVHNNYILSELAQRVEGKDLGITCGFADRYVPLFGGLAYLDYRGKLYHQDIDEEPYAVYERLDSRIPDLPLFAVMTGLQHQSGVVHGRMRPRYLEEHADWITTRGAMPPMVSFMTAIWETAWRGKIALLKHDLTNFGMLMNQNHELVNQMMRYCGFEDGAGWANNLFIEAALEAGALGAKLTGAGGGGSVFALVHPGQEASLSARWQEVAYQAGLNNAVCFQPHISEQGLVVRCL